MITRKYNEASFIFDNQRRDAIFFEGSIAPYAIDYINQGMKLDTNKILHKFSKEYHTDILNDWNDITKCIQNFILKKNIYTKNSLEREHGNALKDLQTYAKNNWQLITTTIETTYQCNLRCKFCYLENYDSKGLNFNTLKRLAIDLRKEGVIFILLTGGEFFLREDYLEILQLFHDENFIIELKTNATLLNEDIILKLQKFNIFDIQVSIYEPYHENQKVINNIRRLKETGIPISLSILVGKHNINQLNIIHEKLNQIFHDSIEIQYTPYLTPNRSSENKQIQEFRLSLTQLKNILYPFLKSIGKYKSFEKFRNLKKDGSICYAGREQVVISPEGEVYPCLDLNVTLGNIQKQSFYNILSERKKILSQFSPQKMKKCLICEYADYCDSCIGINLIENNDYSIPVQHRCDIAQFYQKGGD